MTAYVLIVRDPDTSNEITTDGDVITVDIDLGNAFNGTPDNAQAAITFVESLASQLDKIPTTTKVWNTAIDAYTTATEAYPTAQAIIEGYMDRREGNNRSVYAVTGKNGEPILSSGICGECVQDATRRTASIKAGQDSDEAGGERFTHGRDTADDLIKVLDEVPCAHCGFLHHDR